MRNTSRSPSDSGACFRSTRFEDWSAECVMSWLLVRFLCDNCICSALFWCEIESIFMLVVIRTKGNSSQIGISGIQQTRTIAFLLFHSPRAGNQSWPSGKGCEAKLVRPKKRTTFNNNFSLNGGPCVDADTSYSFAIVSIVRCYRA